MKKLALLLIQIAVVQVVFAQQVPYARQVIDTLTSEHFWGRGYVKDGMKKAADYITAEFESAGVKPITGKGYLQKFTYPVNTFPGKMEVSINGKRLVPGAEFIVGSQSKGFTGQGSFEEMDNRQFLAVGKKVLVMHDEKLTWSVDGVPADYTLLFVKKGSIDGEPNTYSIDIEQQLQKKFEAFNVCGMVKGTRMPDSVVVFSAHYDHLGGMGSATYFPGANDNASGISMLLNVAKHYAANPPAYSALFIAFAGEEAGLLGSKYFVDHPMVPLSSIRFLLNLDLVGTGDEGITVVNATLLPKEFALLNKVNDERKLLPAINARGEAQNSDHYWFTKAGVPAFFIYTLGGIKAYHDIDDKAATLPLTEYEDLFSLIVGFSKAVMN